MRIAEPIAAGRGDHRIRVLVLTNMYPTATEPHFGCFVKDQVDDLRCLGVEVSVLAFDGRSHKHRYLTMAPRLRQALRHDRYDIVHAHYGLSGAIASLQLATPVVTTFHGSDASVPWQRSVSRLVARRTQPIAVAPMIAANLGVREAPVIPCAVDLDLFAPLDRTAARRALGWPSVGPCVLFPGARSDRSKVTNKRVDVFDAMIDRLRRSEVGVAAASLDGLSRKQVALAMNAADVAVITFDVGGRAGGGQGVACMPDAGRVGGRRGRLHRSRRPSRVRNRAAQPRGSGESGREGASRGPRSATAGSHACLWTRANRRTSAPRLSPSPRRAVRAMRDEAAQKVTFICPNLEAGGAERQWAILAPGLCERGFDVSVMTLDGRGVYFEELRARGVRIACAALRHRADPVGLARAAWLGWPRSSAVLTRGVSAHLVGHVLARRQRAAHVVTEHLGDDPLGIRPLRRHQRLLLGPMRPRANAVVAVAASQTDAPGARRLPSRRDTRDPKRRC